VTAEPINTILDVIRTRAQEAPSATAFTFHRKDGREQLTNEQLLHEANGVAKRVETRAKAGDRILLLYPPGLSFIPALFGCMLRGSIPVLCPPPHKKRNLDATERVICDAQPTAVLTCTKIEGETARTIRDSTTPDLPVFATDNVRPETSGQVRTVKPSHLAYLQYTSGSTRNPRAVMISHQNLVRNVESINQTFEVTASTHGVSWLPHFHDMGLLAGIMAPLYAGCPSLLFSPALFLQKPRLWLELISEQEDVISGAPCSAYAHCLSRIAPSARVGLDLSEWRIAFCGAEMVRAEVVKRFGDGFASAGFRPTSILPCYGLAEATLLVSASPAEDEPLMTRYKQIADQGRAERSVPSSAGRLLVSSGKAIPGSTLKIVDPATRRVCSEKETGEVWVRGPGVASGYWNRPERSRVTFEGRLSDQETPNRDRCYLRTGDLGFLDGEDLFVVGRLDDAIVIHGRTLHPEDIEATVEECHPAILAGSGAAFQVDSPLEGDLIVVQEVARRSVNRDDPRGIAAAVRAAIASEHGVAPNTIVLARPHRVPKTSSGKVQRAKCRALFNQGKDFGWYVWRDESRDDRTPRPPQTTTHRTQAEIASWLIQAMARLIGEQNDQIDQARPFEYFGLDSVKMPVLIDDLAAWTGRELSAHVLYEYPTIQSLASFLSKKPTPLCDSESTERQSECHNIGVIGMGCRFPGAAHLEEFLEVLRKGKDCVGQMSRERHMAGFGGVDQESGDECGYLNSLTTNHRAIGIPEREIPFVDPQQTLVLEVVWEALEDAGIPPRSLAGTRTGVFVGASSYDFALQRASSPMKSESVYTATGSALSVIANRISFLLGLQGPSLTIDTACSSSLVAAHMAQRSMVDGECDLAIVAGVNLLLSPSVTESLRVAGFLSPTSRCRAFDQKADGYARGEGAGAVILKKEDPSSIWPYRQYMLLRGSAACHSGSTSGLTTPNPAAQARTLNEAYKRAGVPVESVAYVEAHGTGTILGDQIETDALNRVFDREYSRAQPLRLGTVKTNIGHLEAAAGIAGLIKVGLSLHHGEFYPTLHFTRMSSSTKPGCLRVQVTHEDWPDSIPRRAGVSSFGFGGTNAHMVAEAAPRRRRPSTERLQQYCLPLSSYNHKTLQDLAARLLKRLAAIRTSSVENDETAHLHDVAHSAGVRRQHQSERIAVIAGSLDDLSNALSDYLGGTPRPNLYQSSHETSPRRALLIHFSGPPDDYPVRVQKAWESSAITRLAARSWSGSHAEERAESLEDRVDHAFTLSRIELALLSVDLQCALGSFFSSLGIPADVVCSTDRIGTIAAAHFAGLPQRRALKGHVSPAQEADEQAREFISVPGATKVIVPRHDLESLLPDTVTDAPSLDLSSAVSDATPGFAAIEMIGLSWTEDALTRLLPKLDTSARYSSMTDHAVLRVVSERFAEGSDIDWTQLYETASEFVSLPGSIKTQSAEFTKNDWPRVQADGVIPLASDPSVRIWHGRIIALSQGRPSQLDGTLVTTQILRAIGTSVYGSDRIRIEDLEVCEATSLNEGDLVQAELVRDGNRITSFRLFSSEGLNEPGDGWSLIATGQLVNSSSEGL